MRSANKIIDGARENVIIKVDLIMEAQRSVHTGMTSFKVPFLLY